MTNTLIDRGRRQLEVVRNRMAGLPMVVACIAEALAACTATSGIPVPASGLRRVDQYPHADLAGHLDQRAKQARPRRRPGRE